MGSFSDLKIWQNSHKLTLSVYVLTSRLPKEELFGLTSQLRRAAVSVESNIAEGESRYTEKDKLNFFIQARSSAAEVQTQLLLIHDIYLKLSTKANELKNEYVILSRQINSLISFRRSRI
jgi:four helix bundle protein